MANVIRHKRGTSNPSASDFSSTAELLINTTDGGLFTLNDSNSVVEIGSGGGGGGGSYTHPNHSGEVTSTGDGATEITDNVVDEANLKVSNAPTNGYFLQAQSGNTGGLTWAEVTGGVGGGSSGPDSVIMGMIF